MDFLAKAESYNDPTFMLHALPIAAQAQNLSALAHEVNMNRKGLRKALSGEDNPSFRTFSRLANALDYRMFLEKVSENKNVQSGVN